MLDVGGKAHNLGELFSSGFNVPQWFSVTTEAYRRFIEQSDIREALDAFLKEIDPLEFSELEAATRILEDEIMRRPVPPEIVRDVEEAYVKLMELEDRPGVSVRSSAISEDLAEASFAGIHSTFLNVFGADKVVESVKRCWASLWSAGAVVYRERCGFDHSNVAMAVIVQRMIPAEISGVMFTMDPVTTSRLEIIINSNWGLGESVVSGVATPDVVVVDKESGRILERSDGLEGVTTLLNEEGGIQRTTISVELSGTPTLTDGQIHRLAETGSRIEEKFGCPQDIEWVIAEDKVYIVQSRPVLSLLNRHDIWLHRSPAQISMDKPVIERRLLEKRYGIKVDRESLYQDATKLLVEWEESLLPGMMDDVKAKENLDLQAMSDEELASFFREVVRISRKHFEIRIRMGKLIDVSIERLASFLEGLNFITPEEHPMLLVGFTNMDIESGDFLRRLARDASPSVLEALQRGADALSELKGFDEGARWLEEFDRYLEEFGHLSSAKWDIMSPTYREDPDMLLNAILNYTSAEPDIPNAVSTLIEERDRLVGKVLEALPEEKRSAFLEAARVAQRNYPLKDDRDIYYLRSLYQVRRAFKEVGRRLRERKVTEFVDDVFFLKVDKVQELITDCAVDVEEIRAKIKAEKLRFGERGEVSTSKIIEATKHKYLSTEDGLVLRGMGISPGVSRGRARIVRSLHEFPKLEAGDILVAPAATPAWAPILSLAGGIVTDVGGALSHGGILAREFRIPAVVSTGIGTRVIREGQEIVVDGSEGAVYLNSDCIEDDEV